MRVVGKADLGVADINRHMCTGLETKEERKHHGAGENTRRNDKK